MSRLQDDFRRYSRAVMQFSYARGALLCVTILTAVNILLSVFGRDTVYLFSSAIPYYSWLFGYVLVTSELSEHIIAGCVLIGIGVLYLGLCLLFYFLSKKHYGWLTGAIVIFSIDTVMLIGTAVILHEFTGRADILMVVYHILLEIIFVLGLVGGRKMKKGIPNIDFTESMNNGTDTAEVSSNGEEGDGYPRKADDTVKYRVLLEYTYLNYEIVYRRVKKTNELCVNGYVYDSMEMLVEPAHVLCATVDGYSFTAGYDGLNSYIKVGDELLSKKIRVW